MKKRTNKTWKEIIGILSVTAIISIAFISCGNNKHQDDDLESFRVFITDLKVNTEEKLEENWEIIEKEYEEKIASIDQKEDQLESNIKEEYEQLKKDYEGLKEKFNINHMEDETTAVADIKRDLYATILTNEGDMNLNGVTAANILGVYKAFVEVVDLHKDDYTREDWDEVDILWDALNKRKNELEANLSSSIKLKIGEEKVKYGTYKSLNKLPSKSEEKRSVDK